MPQMRYRQKASLTSKLVQFPPVPDPIKKFKTKKLSCHYSCPSWSELDRPAVLPLWYQAPQSMLRNDAGVNGGTDNMYSVSMLRLASVLC